MTQPDIDVLGELIRQLRHLADAIEHGELTGGGRDSNGEYYVYSDDRETGKVRLVLNLEHAPSYRGPATYDEGEGEARSVLMRLTDDHPPLAPGAKATELPEGPWLHSSTKRKFTKKA